MPDSYEVDFHAVNAKSSGDAITIRYVVNGTEWINIVDGGFIDTGKLLIDHLKLKYGAPLYIDNVVATHNDGDHTGGLREILENYQVQRLWIHRPWRYAAVLIEYFDNYSSVAYLERKLREVYSNLAILEEIAIKKGIDIQEPLQGSQIGHFTVLSPSLGELLFQVVQSERTPDSSIRSSSSGGVLARAVAAAKDAIATNWGVEIFSTSETSAENEMSVVQFAEIEGRRILLTGDAGRTALTNAADYLESIGHALPGVDVFQVPHHGSRRNLSTALLNRWLGTRSLLQLFVNPENFEAIISASKDDPDHPKNVVKKAIWHRGGKVVSTEDWGYICSYWNAPHRTDLTPISSLPYPSNQDPE